MDNPGATRPAHSTFHPNAPSTSMTSTAENAPPQSITMHKITMELAHSDDERGSAYEKTCWTWHLWCPAEGRSTFDVYNVIQQRRDLVHAQAKQRGGGGPSIQLSFYSPTIEELPV